MSQHHHITIGNVTTAVITYQDMRVCTTQQLAQFYGASHDHIHDNYRKNSGRFQEGKHFVKLEGEALRQFKNDIPEISRYVPERTARLTLWTDGCSCAGVIMNGSDVGQICRVMESKDTSGKPAFRFLDARLQALRKRRQIEFCRFTRAWGLSPA